MTEYSAQFLLEIAESANPPYCLDGGIFEEKEFLARDSWKVIIFYDGGDLDYIDHFVSPTGEKIDFWKWPEDSLDREVLMHWRAVGDMAILLSDLPNIERRLRETLAQPPAESGGD